MLFQLSEHSSPGEWDRDWHWHWLGVGHGTGGDVRARHVWPRDGRWWHGWEMVSRIRWGGKEGTWWQVWDVVAGMGYGVVYGTECL